MHVNAVPTRLIDAEQAAMYAVPGDVSSPSHINDVVKAISCALSTPCRRGRWFIERAAFRKDPPQVRKAIYDLLSSIET